MPSFDVVSEVDEHELANALDQAFASGKPAVVDVKTHLDGIAPRSWTPV